MAKKKAVLLRHMKGERDDHVMRWLSENDIEMAHVNPACGVPLPAGHEGFDALVIYGGIQSANDKEQNPYIPEELEWISRWIHAGKPILGICLGSQLLAKCLGGSVFRHPEGRIESGFYKIQPTGESGKFLKEPAYFYQWHSENFSLPSDCTLLATGETFHNQAFRYNSNVYGVQFHPEVTRTMLSGVDQGGCIRAEYSGCLLSFTAIGGRGALRQSHGYMVQQLYGELGKSLVALV